MILDWLLDEVPHDLLKQLEVYTFGNAANHFNTNRAIAHIEHYANSQDFVSRWGVLNFTREMPQNRFENRFIGRVFERPGKGHQFNQHYLDNIFPLDPTRSFVREPEPGDFMDMEVVEGGDETDKGAREGIVQSLSVTMGSTEAEARVLNDSTNGVKVRYLSRLWAYRNGRCPPACYEEDQVAVEERNG